MKTPADAAPPQPQAHTTQIEQDLIALRLAGITLRKDAHEGPHAIFLRACHMLTLNALRAWRDGDDEIAKHNRRLQREALLRCRDHYRQMTHENAEEASRLAAYFEAEGH